MLQPDPPTTSSINKRHVFISVLYGMSVGILLLFTLISFIILFPSLNPNSAAEFSELLRTGKLSPRFLFLLPLLFGAVTILFGRFRYLALSSRDDTAKQISKAESQLEASPEKTKPAWDLARATLEKYFNRNLDQVTLIFWLSVAVMLVGFSLIVWGIGQALYFPANAIPIATITAVAGIVTEFIGATFLFIYRSTIRQAQGYSEMLERINSVGMAMQILDTMPDKVTMDKVDVKSKTKAMLVEILVKQSLSRDGYVPNEDQPVSSNLPPISSSTSQ